MPDSCRVERVQRLGGKEDNESNKVADESDKLAEEEEDR